MPCTGKTFARTLASRGLRLLSSNASITRIFFGDSVAITPPLTHICDTRLWRFFCPSVMPFSSLPLFLPPSFHPSIPPSLPPPLLPPPPLPLPPPNNSGAMDKFTAKAGGGGVNGGAVKRTKIVQKTKTYMEGGYMKTVNEEVEVTDDEEEVRVRVVLVTLLRKATNMQL